MHLKFGIMMTLALAGVLLLGSTGAQAGGSGCHDSKITDQSATSVDLKGNCFFPTVVRVDAGQQIAWTNRDVTAHTVSGVGLSWGTYDELSQQDAVTYSFDNPGVFPYYCLLHPGMVGAVVVGEGAPAASTSGGAGVKAVSAQVAGGDGETATGGTDSKESAGSSGGTDELMIAGIALFALVLGAGGTLAVRRRAR